MTNYALYSLGIAYLFWLLFLVVMALKLRWAQLPKVTKTLAAPVALFALLFDVGFNYTLACVLFLDFPRGTRTFSQRIGNYKNGNDWRKRPAAWICGNLLDPFEQGGHCR